MLAWSCSDDDADVDHGEGEAPVQSVASAKRDVRTLAGSVSELVTCYMRVEMRESEALMTEALRKASMSLQATPSAATTAKSAHSVDNLAGKQQNVYANLPDDPDLAERLLQLESQENAPVLKEKSARARKSHAEKRALERPTEPAHHTSDEPAREQYSVRQGSWRDAIHFIDDDGEPIDADVVNYKEAVTVAAVAERHAAAAITAIEKSSSLKSQLSEVRRRGFHTRFPFLLFCFGLNFGVII